jgi:hypothetical protein
VSGLSADAFRTAARIPPDSAVNVMCEKYWLAATRFARIQGTAFCPLKKITRPAPPALGHLGNRKQPIGLMAITGIDAEHMSDGEIMIGSLDYPDLISGTHISLDNDS